ncbi:nucleotide-binding oligomerization domain-containing protein 2 [Denticeps clupeoides]|uniref:nucleotide-binding oligomerization domain-containing protein 2 n=1 Tax=Denticeps clupeoides TaxID=299321 RepID=UPI0010A46D02|nr:nucleotide-binding oligomerization domain-containing protein 2 [Denticeps clupeoides]
MSAQKLVLSQRAELVQALSRGGTAEGVDCVLDLLISWGVLLWEDYVCACVANKPLSTRTRDLLDLVYEKGERACELLLCAFCQVLPEAQKTGLEFGKCVSVVKDDREPSTMATETLLCHRPFLVSRLRDHVDGALEHLLGRGCLTSADREEIQLPVYTSSQQARRLLDKVRFRGEDSAMVLLHYLDRTTSPPPPEKENEQPFAEWLVYQKKLCSSILAQCYFLSTCGGAGKYSLDDVYTDGLLELSQGCGDTQVSLGLEDVLGQVGTLNEEADTVLVSGQAGSGKSTLLQRLHLLWARREALQDFLLLFPFSCRKLNAEERELSLRDLLFLHCCWPDRDQDKLFAFVLDNPHLVLLTFDGLDEFKQSFSDERRHCCPTQAAPMSTLLFNLLQGSLMKGVRKLVTSRPEAAGPSLRQYLRKEVLLKGFSPGGIDCFVRKHHQDRGVASGVLQALQSNTALLGLCHIPVFCWIVSKCYKELLGCGKGSPQTFTDVYLMVLQHFFRRKSPQQKSLGSSWLLEHFQTIMHLGQLAFEGLDASCYIFSEVDLQNSGVAEEDITIGFLIHSKNFSSTDERHFEFLHITMQCFFAALHIVLSDKTNLNQIRTLFQTQCKSKGCIGFCQPREQSVMTTESSNPQITAKFVSGLLSQHHSDLLQQSCSATMLGKKSKCVVKCVSKGVQRHFKSIPQPVKGEKKSMHAMPSFVWLISCIYEMQDSDVAMNSVARLEVDHLKLTYCNIGPVECTALAYVLQYLRCPVGLQLDYNCVGDVGVEQLLPCLPVCSSLYLRNNNISDEGIRRLIDKGVHCESFKKIALFSNNLTDACTQDFAHLLKTKQIFLSLRLGNNNITSRGAEQLAEGLRCSQSLQYLGLWGNKIGDRGAEALAEALKDNTSLVWLSLVGNGIGNSGAQALAKIIQKSKTLEEMWLSKNCITRVGVEYIVKALEENVTVKSVWLRGNNLSQPEVEEFQRECRLIF